MYQEIKYSVLNGDIVPKGDILDYWGTLIYFYHPIIYYQIIKVYRIERMDIGKILLTSWCKSNMQMQPSQ